jgi:hypothetical protein
MIDAKRAKNIADQLEVMLRVPDMKDFLIVIPFESSGSEDEMHFISSSRAECPHNNMMMVTGTLRVLIQGMMKHNGLTPVAASGALHALVDEAAEEVWNQLEEMGDPVLGEA